MLYDLPALTESQFELALIESDQAKRLQLSTRETRNSILRMVKRCFDDLEVTDSFKRREMLENLRTLLSQLDKILRERGTLLLEAGAKFYRPLKTLITDDYYPSSLITSARVEHGFSWPRTHYIVFGLEGKKFDEYEHHPPMMYIYGDFIPDDEDWQRSFFLGDDDRHHLSGDDSSEDDDPWYAFKEGEPLDLDPRYFLGERYFFSYYDFFDISSVKPLNPSTYHVPEGNTLLADYGYPQEINEGNFEKFLPARPLVLESRMRSTDYNIFERGTHLLRDVLHGAGFTLDLDERPQGLFSEKIKYCGGWTASSMVRYIRKNIEVLRGALGFRVADSLDYWLQREYNHPLFTLLTLCHLIIALKNASLTLDTGKKWQIIKSMNKGWTTETIITIPGKGKVKHKPYNILGTLIKHLIGAKFLDLSIDQQLSEVEKYIGFPINSQILAELVAKIFEMKSKMKNMYYFTDCKDSRLTIENLQSLLGSKATDRASLCSQLTSGESEVNCEICGEGLSHELAITLCGHVFDKACLDEYLTDVYNIKFDSTWANPDAKCPVCGEKLVP